METYNEYLIVFLFISLIPAFLLMFTNCLNKYENLIFKLFTISSVITLIFVYHLVFIQFNILQHLTK